MSCYIFDKEKAILIGKKSNQNVNDVSKEKQLQNNQKGYVVVNQGLAKDDNQLKKK